MKTLWGKMKTLINLTIDNLINLYEGKVVQDRVNIAIHSDGRFLSATIFEKELAQDKMILGALKCAKANGFIGE